MNRRVTILMYHYIRDLKNSRFPRTKGLATELFSEQLLYLRKHYHPITVGEFLHALQNPGYALPPASLLLTFDDGFSDHYENVTDRKFKPTSAMKW